MLIPTLIVMRDKHVHFEESSTDNNSNQQAPQQSSSLPQKQRGSSCMQPQWCEVRRDFKGRKIIVAHKAPCYGNGPNTNGGGGEGGTQDVKKGANGGGNGSGKKGEEKKEEKKAEGGDGKKPHEFTAEEDEKLKALKGEEKTWADIATEMGKPKGVLTQRWKVINPDKVGGDGGEDNKKKGGKGGGGDGNGGKKKDDEKPAEEKAAKEPKQMTNKEKKAAAKKEADAAAAAKEAKKEEPKSKSKSKPASKAPSSKAGSDACFTKSEWLTLQEDDIFSFGELQLLAELVVQYDAGRWQMVASRFYDKTGRRVHPDDVKDKFAGLME